MIAALGAALAGLLLVGCDTSKMSPPGSDSPAAANEARPTSIPTVTTAVPHEPTYVVYGRALYATAQAIVYSLPTPSPIPGLHPDDQTEVKRRYLWSIALPTAHALFPPPPNYDVRSEITPEAQPPLPTEEPYPSTPTTNGKIYNRSLEDNPEGNLLGEVNYWVGEVGGSRTLVFAGHAVGTPSQGIIIVEARVAGTVTVDGPTNRIDNYLTPSQAGAVRIISEVGGRFILQAADGSFFYFDINARQWVSSAPNPSPSVSVSPISSVTPIQTSTAGSGYALTPQPSSKEAYWTAVAQSDAAIATEVALTHAPRDTPGPPPVYPTPTWAMGIIPDCANASAQGPQCINIWRGVLNGEIVQVEGGQESYDDPSQGIAIVFTFGHNDLQIYKTPQKVGVVRVAAVDGTRVTFAPVDFRIPQVLLTPWTTATPGTTFVFDLATRQWVSP
jgi:hypothetical protein